MIANIFITDQPLVEHHLHYHPNAVLGEYALKACEQDIYFKGQTDNDCRCFWIEGRNKPGTSYFIGADWVNESMDKAVMIVPKFDQESSLKLDVHRMLFELFSRVELLEHIEEVYEIKWESKWMKIPAEYDLLTPIIMIRYLALLRRIVKKGLWKSYYRRTDNLRNRIKGKIEVTATIRQNVIKNRLLQTTCSFEEFGINNLENRLLKKALTFVQRYVSQLKTANSTLTQLVHYVAPAFVEVNEEIDLHEVKHSKINPFYKEYESAIQLARIILRKYSYSINNIKPEAKEETPPYWIDMSKLFELHVYNKLLEVHGSEVVYQFNASGTFPDFLLKKSGLVVDAKYKKYNEKSIDINDVRQVSAYAREVNVRKELGLNVDSNQQLDCLIIYPDTSLCSTQKLELSSALEVSSYKGIKKLGVGVPLE